MMIIPQYDFMIFFEASGNWICPDNVSEILLIGSGGGSGGASGGVGGATTFIGGLISTSFPGGASSASHGRSGIIGRGVSNYAGVPFFFSGGSVSETGKEVAIPAVGAAGSLLNGGAAGVGATTFSRFEGGSAVGKHYRLKVTPGQTYALTIGSGGNGGSGSGGGAGGFIAILYNKEIY